MHLSKYWLKWPYCADFDFEQLAQVFSKCSALQGLARSSLLEVTRCLRRLSVPPGQAIVCEGEASLCWYVIVSGSGVIDVDKTSSTSEKLTVAKLVSGMAFGEFGMIYNQTRSATVKASSDGAVLAVMSRSDYERILKEFHRRTIFENLHRKLDFLQHWKLFNEFSSNALIALSYLLEFRRVKAGSVLYQSKGTLHMPALSFVIGGTVTIYYKSQEGSSRRHTMCAGGNIGRVTEMLATAEPGYFFGHLSTPDSVMKIVASEYHDVDLLQADTKEIVGGHFGEDVVHVMKKHQADETHMLSLRVEQLRNLMHEIEKTLSQTPLHAGHNGLCCKYVLSPTKRDLVLSVRSAAEASMIMKPRLPECFNAHGKSGGINSIKAQALMVQRSASAPLYRHQHHAFIHAPLRYSMLNSSRLLTHGWSLLLTHHDLALCSPSNWPTKPVGVSQRAGSAARNRDVRAGFGAHDVAVANLSIASASTRKQMAVQEEAGARASETTVHVAGSKSWENDEKVW